MGSQNQQSGLDKAVPSDSLVAAGRGITGPGHGQNLIAWMFFCDKALSSFWGRVCEMLIPCRGWGRRELCSTCSLLVRLGLSNTFAGMFPQSNVSLL